MRISNFSLNLFTNLTNISITKFKIFLSTALCLKVEKEVVNSSHLCKKAENRLFGRCYNAIHHPGDLFGIVVKLRSYLNHLKWINCRKLAQMEIFWICAREVSLKRFHENFFQKKMVGTVSVKLVGNHAVWNIAYMLRAIFEVFSVVHQFSLFGWVWK